MGWHLHQWGSWEDVKLGDTLKAYPVGPVAVFNKVQIITQQRRCAVCNKVQTITT